LGHAAEGSLALLLGGGLESSQVGRLGGLVLGLLELELELSTALSLCVGVEADESTNVAERVELAGKTASVLLLAVKLGLNFIRVDDTGNISVGHNGVGKSEVALNVRLLVQGSEDLVQLLESSLGPDDETSQMSSGSELEERKAINVGNVQSDNVAESVLDVLVVGVDEERTTAESVTTVSHLTLSGADLLGLLGTGNIEIGVMASEDLDGILGLLDRLDSGRENEGNLLELADSVSASNDESGDSRGSEGSADGQTTFVGVGHSVPLAPDLVGGEHTTSSAHVTEATLSRARSTSSSDTGNTCDGTTGSPRLGRGLLSGNGLNSIRLTLVLGNVLVNALNKINTDGRSEDCRKGRSARHSL